MVQTVKVLNATGVEENLYGRQETPGLRSEVTARRIRKASHAEVEFLHRTKNGIYDPITFYHLLDALMRLEPNSEFRTADLVIHLQTAKRQLVWDSVTVGRVLNDIAESLHDAYGAVPISAVRRWNGMYYVVHGGLEFKVMQLRLLDDLYRLCEEMLANELAGLTIKRTVSPLVRCPSVAVVL